MISIIELGVTTGYPPHLLSFCRLIVITIISEYIFKPNITLWSEYWVRERAHGFFNHWSFYAYSHLIVMATFLNWNLGKEKRGSRNPSNGSISNPNPDQYAAHTHLRFMQRRQATCSSWWNSTKNYDTDIFFDPGIFTEARYSWVK